MEEKDQWNNDDINHSNIPYMYVNAGGVATGDNDFIMQIETALPSGRADIQNLIMSPRMAKEFRDMLAEAVEEYEGEVGEIYQGTKIVDKYTEKREENE